jgi:hypothetical protein
LGWGQSFDFEFELGKGDNFPINQGHNPVGSCGGLKIKGKAHQGEKNG